MASGTPDRRPTKPNGSTPQPGPSNLTHQPHYGYSVPQYMAPYPMPHMPHAQMYPQHPHIQSYPHYGYQQPMYQQHPVHSPQGYPPPMQYMPHMQAPHPHYPSPTLTGPYQHPTSPWSPAPPSMPPNDPGMSTPPVYATPYAPPPPMHHGGQTLYQSSQSFTPRNIAPSPSNSGFRHLASPRPNVSQIRSPSHQHARIPDQSQIGGSASGSPSGRQVNQPAPLPTISVEQQNEVAVVAQSPKAEPPTVVDEPIPATISSLPSQPPPQPPPPPAEEVKMEAVENEEDSAIRFSGGRIPTPNAESIISFAAPLSMSSSSPPPVDVAKENRLDGPPQSSGFTTASLPPPSFTSAPVFDDVPRGSVSTNNAPGVSHSPSASVSQAKDAPATMFSIAKRRPQVTDAPAISFSRRAKMPASVVAAAVPLPASSKPVVKLPAAAPTPSAPVNSTDVSTLKPNVKESVVPDANKAPPKSQKPATTKPPSFSSAVAPTEPSSAVAPPAPEASTTATDAVAPAPTPVPVAPPVKQPPKSWAALLRPTTPAKSAKPPQAPAQKPTGTVPAKTASDVEPKVNGHANGIFEPLPTDAPLHVILAEGAKPYSAHSQVTQPRGLINAGNMCFANVVMQALVYSAPFVRLFETLAQLVPGNLSGKTALYEATIMFLREFPAQTEGAASIKSKPHSGTSTPVGPEQTRQQVWNETPFFPELLYEAMKQNKRFDNMQRGHQEDAEEFLGFFLDTLHEELLSMLSKVQIESAPAEAAWTNGAGPAGNPQAGDNAREVQRPVSPDRREEDSGWLEVGKKNRAAVTRTTRATESAITKIFGGKLRSVLQTPGSKDSVTLEPFQPLQLDIQSDNVRTIEDALRNITIPETVSVFSESRGGQVDAKKQVTLDTLPPLLILHLKRLVYDAKGIQKNSKVIGYPTTLEIRPEIISPTRRTNRSIKYHLYGVVYHHGKHATGGHYTIDALRQDHSEWVRIDDTHIESITQKDVTAHEKHAKLDKTAYLLFYRREPDNLK